MEDFLGYMTKRRMANVMRQRGGLDRDGIKPTCLGNTLMVMSTSQETHSHCLGNMRNFQCMCKSIVGWMAACWGDDLRDAAQATEFLTIENSVPVVLRRSSKIPFSGIIRVFQMPAIIAIGFSSTQRDIPASSSSSLLLSRARC